MKRVVYAGHLKLRLAIRNIPFEIPEKIYREALEHYYDRDTDHKIATKSLRFGEKTKEVMIAYDEFPDRVEIITIHPLKSKQKQQRIESGRWKRL